MALGGPEILVILIVLALISIPAVIVVIVAVVISSRKKHEASLPPPEAIQAQAKLQEIESLYAQGLISQTEHDEKRKQIIDAI